MASEMNIGSRGRAARLVTGLIGLAVAVAGAAWLRSLGTAPMLRALLALPFGFGVLGVLQAQAGT